MDVKYLYLLLNIGTILVPFLFSFRKIAPFYKSWRWYFPANFIVAVAFILWDIAFTKMGIWGFNPTYLSGIYIANLPLEEVLFFFTIPYACTFIFFSFQYYFPNFKLKPQTSKKLFIAWALISLVIGVLFYNRWYTATTFLSCAGLLFVLAKNYKPYYGQMVLAYAISVLPFMLVNGVLTGSFIPDEVVWYNDAENLGIRLFTIPIDDTHYSLLLQFLNVSLFMWIKDKFQGKNKK